MMKYVLTTDDDGHWYVIPADKQDDWWRWLEDSDNFDLPEWADEVGGAPSLVIFKEYTIQ